MSRARIPRRLKDTVLRPDRRRTRHWTLVRRWLLRASRAVKAKELQLQQEHTPMKLYAWIGEDEYGSGIVGLKIGRVPAGLIPLVVIEQDREKLIRPHIVAQLQRQAIEFGKVIRFAEFTLTADSLLEVRPTEPEEGG